jgi:steroid delta-isomerase
MFGWLLCGGNYLNCTWRPAAWRGGGTQGGTRGYDPRCSAEMDCRFQCGNAEEVCNLFSPELRYDFRGQSERNYKDICSLLHHSLEDGTKKYAYTLQIKEILVWGELAVVRLVWTLRMWSINPPGSFAESIEPGMDIFRRQADGSWKIIRYLAYEE